jgi:tetratricopeptide (TPR) repeat protein
MSFSKIMGKFKVKNQHDAQSVFKGSPSELKEAYRIANSGKWGEALAIVDRILDMPDDTQAAIKYLKDMMRTGDKLGVDTRIMGSDISGNHLMKSQIYLGGEMIPILMTFRGQCILRHIFDIMEKNKSIDGESIDKSVFGETGNKAVQHIEICAGTLWDTPDCIYYLGAICHTIGKLSAARLCFERTLELDPSNEMASKSLALAKERMKQFPGQ